MIIGGGLVGASLACALGHYAQDTISTGLPADRSQPLRVALVEAVAFKSSHQPSYDDRSIALAYGSKQIFASMGLWPQLAEQATAIKQIHISDRGHFGFSHLDCADSGHEALGYVIENRTLGATFAGVLPSLFNVDVLCPATLKQLSFSDAVAQVTLAMGNSTRQLSTRLVVGADGGQSAVRELCRIKTRQWDYGQSAIIANITPSKPHQHVAYERFTANGPLAILPMTSQRCSLVWTQHQQQVEATMALSDTDFLHELQQAFGYRLGTLQQVGKRSVYPLQLIRAQSHQQPRLVLIGNAAHTLHPIAGQGFNLGIRDVAALAQVIVDAAQQQQDIGGNATLQSYEEWRRNDQRHVTALTDSLVRLFSNNFTPLVLARNAGLLALDLVPPLKRRLLQQTMGLRGRLPRLARGLPLL